MRAYLSLVVVLSVAQWNYWGPLGDFRSGAPVIRLGIDIYFKTLISIVFTDSSGAP